MEHWLHIHILDGQLYVFTDNGHWKNNPSCGWDKAQEITSKQWARECCIGSVFQPAYTKFGMQYLENVMFRISIKDEKWE